jgi:nucleoside-diphosphate-sugar epimerase
VDDLVSGLLAVMESSRADAPGRVYNLGNPEEHTIREYAELVLDLIPTTASRLTYCDPVPDDPSRRRPDISRARGELGWQPRVALRDGVARTIQYFREVTAPR